MPTFVAEYRVRQALAFRIVNLAGSTPDTGADEPVDPDVGLLTDAGHEVVHVEPGPLTGSLVLATWALFSGLAVMLVGAGLFATLIAVRTEIDGFNALSIGLVSGAYYGGFLAGSRLSLRILATVGHIRVYAALASLLSALILTSGFLAHPVAWIALRFLAGACLAGQYVVAESWLNQLVSNQGRGRLLALYTLTTVVAYGVGQFLFSQVDPTALTGFGIAAVLISIAVTPVALSSDAAPPVIARPDPMPLRELWRIVPTGVVTSVLVGITHGSFLGLGGVYAARSGLSLERISLFVAMPTLGSLLLSLPVTTFSDGRDRRLVGAGAATVAAGAGVFLWAVGAESWWGLVAMFVIGGMTYPLYSIAGAYTNDWVPAAKLTAVAGQLVLLFGAGAFLGPTIGSFVMNVVGPSGFAWMTLTTHGAIAVFLIVRAIQHPTSERAKPWNEVPIAGRMLYLPATAVAMGRRLRPQRRRAR